MVLAALALGALADEPEVSFHGLVDAYASHRLQGDALAPSEFRIFDGPNDSLQLAYVEGSVDVQSDHAGARIDIGFGSVADFGSVDSVAPGMSGVSEVFKHVQQGYVTYKADLGGRALAVDVGRFTTSAGAEVIEAKDDWLYTRTWLFNYGPFMHTGARATLAWNDNVSTQLSLVNGWEYVNDNNAHKTFGVSQKLSTGDGTTVFINAYSGIESSKEHVRRDFVDLVATQDLGDKAAVNVNADVGLEGGDTWYGGALSAKYQVAPPVRLAVRGEYFGDPDGNRMGVPDLSLIGVTLGAGFAFDDLAELRLEVRHDHASEDVFAGGDSAEQSTGTIAALAWF